MIKLITPLSWLTTVIVGFYVLFSHANTPAIAAPKIDWPNNTILEKSTNLPTLVMFLHTQCPCSKASVSELIKVMAKTQGKSKVIAVFYKPESEKDEWITDGELYKKLSKTSAQLVIDTNGVEADKFKSKTSGQTYLFAQTGETVFEGGLTESRGHEGESLGQEKVVSYLNNPKEKNFTLAAVFGCSLSNPERKQ